MGKWSDILDGGVAGSAPAAPHITALGFPRPAGWEPGRVWYEWNVGPQYFTPMGTLFGGYLSALADHAMANALFTLLNDDEAVSTTDLHTSFYRPVREGLVRVEATVTHKGRRSAFCEVRFIDSEGKALARASATQVIVNTKS